MISSIPYRGGSCRTVSSDLSARAVSRSRTWSARMPDPEQTCSAASSVAPPVKTANRRHTARSPESSRSQLQSTTARSVWCLGTVVRPPPVSSWNRSARRVATCSGAMVRSRAAASSMASGMPSSARQILATAAAFPSVTSKPGRTAPARGEILDATDVAVGGRPRPPDRHRDSRATAFGIKGGRYGGVRRQRERTYGPERFPGDVQRFPARGQDAHPRAGGQDAVGEGGRGRDQVLAVVEDQQRPLPGQRGQQPAERIGLLFRPGRERRGRAARVQERLLAQAERPQHGGGDVRGVGQRRQLDQPHPVGHGVHLGPGRLDRQAGLARAARAGEGEQAVRAE
jgi:hypothetical protein